MEAIIRPTQETSPITGGSMSIKYEYRELVFRKEKYTVICCCYICNDTGTQFTSPEQDEATILQVHNQYREKYGIPNTLEIKTIRKQYGLPAATMSTILGFGTNQWRLYEQGEIPNASNGKLIHSIRKPRVFLDMVENSRHVLQDDDYTKIIGKAHDAEVRYQSTENKNTLLKGYTKGIYNGFASLSEPKLNNLLLLILSECKDLFCTKLNKLLFYIDFLSYRERGVAISGLSYRAIDFGPVPDHWEKVYSAFDNIHLEPRMVGDFEGTVLIGSQSADMSYFQSNEIEIIKKVCNQFSKSNSRELTKLSHEEDGWKDNHNAHAIISFNYAISLKAF